MMAVWRGLNVTILICFAAIGPVSAATSTPDLETLIDAKMPIEAKNVILRQLQILSQIPASPTSAPLHDSIFGGPPSGELYIQWFRERVSVIRFDPEQDMPAKAGSILAWFFSPKNKPTRGPIILGPGYFRFDSIRAISVLLHEARHRDGYAHSFAHPYSYESDDDFPKPRDSCRGAKSYDTKFPGADAATIVFLAHWLKGFSDGSDAGEMTRRFVFEDFARRKHFVLSLTENGFSRPEESPSRFDFLIEQSFASALLSDFAQISHPEDRAKLRAEISGLGLIERISRGDSRSCAP